MGEPTAADIVSRDDHAVSRRKRLSADLPQHWLHDPAYWLLTDRAWRLYTHALMFCIGRTDGLIPEAMLSTLLPGTDADRESAAAELVASGKWEKTKPGGWRFSDWTEHQSTREQIEQNRAKERNKKRRQRASRVPDVARVSPRDIPGGVVGGTPAREYGMEWNGMERQADEVGSTDGRCVAPGCGRAARNSCVTCAEHMRDEVAYRGRS